MKLVIREEAVDDLDEIHDWIAKDNLSAANRMVRTLRQRMNSVLLPELVNIGRPGRKKGTRELVEWPYIIVYKVDDNREVITILAVVHGARSRHAHRQAAVAFCFRTSPADDAAVSELSDPGGGG